MNCPKCHSTEIDSGGFCLVCGLRAFSPEELAATGPVSRTQPMPAEGAVSVQQAELPEWRQELSRRLQEIKSKREVGEALAAADAPPVEPEASAVPQAFTDAVETELSRPSTPRRSRRTPRYADRDISQTMRSAPEPESPPVGAVPSGSGPQFAQEPPPVQSAGDIVIRPAVGHVDASRKQYTQDLIDTAVAKLAVREPIPAPQPAPEPGPAIPSLPKNEPGMERGLVPVAERKPEAKSELPSAPAPGSHFEGKREPFPAFGPEMRPEAGTQRKAAPKPASNTAPKEEAPPKVEPEPVPAALKEFEFDPAASGDRREARLILLSRTLAGLVDFIIIVLCAGLMIVTVDILEGIEVFDAVSKIYYGLLFLVMYFVYSVFFLGMANQTIGMMLTDLRLTDTLIRRPSVRQILIRCCAFLLSLLIAGLGLVWGFFDRQARCLHDLLSRTRVVRTSLD